MALLTNLRSILDFPLKDFPKDLGRSKDLYELRVTSARTDGYFLLKCHPSDYFESSLVLNDTSNGLYMLGCIIASESIHRPGAIYYDVYIHGGSLNACAFCTNPEELAAMLRELDARGMEYVFTDNEVWGEIAEDDENPFDQIFVEFPEDPRFASMIEGEMMDKDDYLAAANRLEGYFEQ